MRAVLTHAIAKVKTETEANTLCGPLGQGTDADPVTEQTEIVLAPALERQSMTADIAITVGQRSQQKKKRKRKLSSGGAEYDTGMFDYTTEPSLLDVGDLREVGPLAKKRNKGEVSGLATGVVLILTPSKKQHQRSTEISRLPPKPIINPGAVISHIHSVDTSHITLYSVVV
jgi:hypothetical protein